MASTGYSRALPELRPFLSVFPGFDLTIPPAEGLRPFLAAGPPPQLPDAKVVSIDQALMIPGGKGQPMRVMVVRPVGEAVVPVILAIHGGGGVVGAPEMDLPLYTHFAENGYAVVSPDYRLAPEDPHPAQFDDVEATFNWLVSDAASALKVDTSKLAFYGSSAGAWLATGLAIRLNNKKSEKTARIVVLDSILADDRPIYPLQADDHPLKDYMIWSAQNSCNCQQFLYGSDDPKLEIEAAPLRSTNSSDFVGLPPHYVSSCELDSLGDQGPAYAALLSAAGVSVGLKTWRATFHAFVTLAPTTKIAAVAMKEYLRVIEEGLL